MNLCAKHKDYDPVICPVCMCDELVAGNAQLRRELLSMKARHPENACEDMFPKLQKKLQEAELLISVIKRLVELHQ